MILAVPPVRLGSGEEGFGAPVQEQHSSLLYGEIAYYAARRRYPAFAARHTVWPDQHEPPVLSYKQFMENMDGRLRLRVQIKGWQHIGNNI